MRQFRFKPLGKYRRRMQYTVIYSTVYAANFINYTTCFGLNGPSLGVSLFTLSTYWIATWVSYILTYIHRSYMAVPLTFESVAVSHNSSTFRPSWIYTEEYTGEIVHENCIRIVVSTVIIPTISNNSSLQWWDNLIILVIVTNTWIVPNEGQCLST
jgi:hypothetical protein